MKYEQIIETAKKLFTKYGYKRVSMDEIAKEANVTKKTIYSYFSSKEDLLKYFITEEIKKMKEIVEKTENPKLPYFENVHNVICKLLTYKKESDFLKIIEEESEIFSNPIVINSLKQIDEEIKQYIKKRLQELIDKKYIEVDDLAITSFLIYKMYIALMLEWPEENIEEQKIADNIIKILRNGLERKDEKNNEKK